MTPGKVLVLMGGVRALVGVPVILGKSAIPFVGLSSGSVAANGAISGITALPVAYAAAYCYFPANALATVSAAGWYYCTFSTTSAGVAFLDQPTFPYTVPAGTPVTDGKGAFTGATTELFGPTITIPAGVMGPNGAIRYSLGGSNNNSAGTKTTKAYLGATNVHNSGAMTTTTNISMNGVLSNSGSAAVQKIRAFQTNSASTLASTLIQNISAIDTTAATTFRISIARNTATDNAIIEDFQAELLSDGT